MENTMFLLLHLLAVPLVYNVLVCGQTPSPADTFPTCSYLNRPKVEGFASNTSNVEFIEADSASGSDVNFTLTSSLHSDEKSILVTLTPVNLEQNEIQIIAIQTFDVADPTWDPKGEWIEEQTAGAGFCRVSMVANAVYENPSEARNSYTYRWKPNNVIAEEIIFRATVRYKTIGNVDVFFFGIKSEPATIPEVGNTTEPPIDESSKLPLDIIIVCASVFLVVILIIALCLFVVHRKGKPEDERRLEDSTEINDYQFQQGTSNNGHETSVKAKVEEIEEDKLEDLPQFGQKYVKPKRLSDAVEDEIKADGGTLGRREGATELKRSHVIMKEMIGEGAFGDVYRAQAIGVTNDPITTVAVKILKDATVADTEFKKELKILMTFEPHPNVIQLMGTCTEKEPYFLVLEYAAFGDLRAYLHQQRSESGKEKLNPKQLIDFAVQIAKGMEYIASKDCVHRDLATRNVLLGEGLVCKLSDFGLARNIGTKRQYEMKTDTRLPVRWLAPESIEDNIYTTKSDVWSFGVLCWELVTMGSHPYGGYKASEVIKMVIHGERLAKPSHCSTEMYDVIMTACWQQKPARRPDFTNLRQQLEMMLANAEDNIVTARFDSKGYVYLKPKQWQNSEGEPGKKKRMKRKKTIPNNYELQFQGREK